MPSLTNRISGSLLATLFLVGAASLPFDASAQSRHGGQSAHGQQRGGGHWRGGNHFHGGYRGNGWAGLALGIGLGALIISRPWEPVIVERPTYMYPEPPAPPPPPDYLADARPVPRQPDPIVYPNRGQSDDRLEGDRQACNRWATTQPNAMADARVFHRATLACLEGRGYTVK